MPTYEYSCRDCGEPLEVVQSIHDDSLTTCPSCGGSLRKLFGNVGVVFKGSGFYKNDSRSTTKSTEVARRDSKKDAGSSSGKGDSGNGAGKSDSASSSSTSGSTGSGSGST
ncbi:MAG: FmdB family transcriptional regulator, partial [Actinobacteria bacterium]|nr:FmdB family transcriptional regulator [Actinomycetota bacterium]